jgi:hypothetical protein
VVSRVTGPWLVDQAATHVLVRGGLVRGGLARGGALVTLAIQGERYLAYLTI